jgi:hypothetical protein
MAPLPVKEVPLSLALEESFKAGRAPACRASSEVSAERCKVARLTPGRGLSGQGNVAKSCKPRTRCVNEKVDRDRQEKTETHARKNLVGEGVEPAKRLLLRLPSDRFVCAKDTSEEGRRSEEKPEPAGTPG